MFDVAERRFALNFLNTLPVHNESLVFSPLSIALVLSLVHTGVRGSSRDQIRNTLLSGATDEQLVEHFSFVSKEVKNGTKGVEVYLANKVYLKKGFTVNPTFLSTALKNYGADAKSLDLTTPAAVQEINSFVNTATNGKIKNIATQDSIKDAIALLINSIYFKADWDDKFDGMSVSEQDFTLHTGEKKKIKFMKEFMNDRSFSSDDVFDVLHVAYSDQRYQFSVFLPKLRNSLKEALKKLNEKRFNDLLKTKKRTFMNTQLPKFTIEKDLNLKSHLQTLGITDIFSDSADLSGLAENLKISEGVHKAIIEVNEEGTTAAAVTMMKAVPMSARMEQPVNFIADHPFFFTITFLNHPIFVGVFNG